MKKELKRPVEEKAIILSEEEHIQLIAKSDEIFEKLDQFVVHDFWENENGK